MEDQYGSDFITIEDEDGTEYELEVLSTLEYNGSTYLAVVRADSGEAEELEVSPQIRGGGRRRDSVRHRG